MMIFRLILYIMISGTLENINYTFNLESKILNVNSQEILSNIEIYNVLGQQVLIENLNN